MISESIQNYLKTIYLLGAEGKTVTTSALADSLGISAASATHMIKKLATLQLARHSPYRGVELNKAGEKIALEVIRHHRLIETFLAEALGMPWDRVHVEAEKIEHVISEELEDRIADYLGDPKRDPHGDPIPTRAGILDDPRRPSLADIAEGETAVVQRIGAQDPQYLRHFSRMGIVPRARVSVIHREPFEGPLHVRVGSGPEQVLDKRLATNVLVATPSPRLTENSLKRRSTKSKGGKEL